MKTNEFRKVAKEVDRVVTSVSGTKLEIKIGHAAKYSAFWFGVRVGAKVVARALQEASQDKPAHKWLSEYYDESLFMEREAKIQIANDDEENTKTA